MKQISDTILMIRPVAFRRNEKTKVNNYFKEELDVKNSQINATAQQEFERFVKKQQGVGVNVIVETDFLSRGTLDSIFSNNCVS